MNKVPVTNWLAVLGIGGTFAFPGDAVAQERPLPETPRAERADENTVYWVINHEEQYSVWPGRLKPPGEWKPMASLGSLESSVEALGRRAEGLRFAVVINHEEQYSIWPVEYELPEGFRPVIDDCALEECAELVMEQRR